MFGKSVPSNVNLPDGTIKEQDKRTVRTVYNNIKNIFYSNFNNFRYKYERC